MIEKDLSRTSKKVPNRFPPRERNRRVSAGKGISIFELFPALQKSQCGPKKRAFFFGSGRSSPREIFLQRTEMPNVFLAGTLGDFC